jgi:AraC family transcriptional regulator
MAVQATLQLPVGTIRVVRFNFAAPIDDVLLNTQSHWLELSLTPRVRNARACYPDRWRPHRFEAIGDVFMVPAGQTFHARGDSGSHTGILCLLHSDPIRCWIQDNADWTDSCLSAALNIRCVNIRNLLLRLGEEAQHPGFASEAMTTLITEQLLIELARYYSSRKDEPAIGALEQWCLHLIDERLMDLSQTPTLAELAALCNLSTRQLTRAFRVSRGCSIGNYIAQNRIDRAKRSLERGESIKVISYSLGFSSPAAFTYAFHRATGNTPGAYRRNFNNSK